MKNNDWRVGTHGACVLVQAEVRTEAQEIRELLPWIIEDARAVRPYPPSGFLLGNKFNQTLNKDSMKDGWEIKKLGEVATYVNGYAFKPEHWGSDGLPIIRIQNLNNQGAEFNYSNIEIPAKFVVDDGDILVSWSASLGVYEWNRGKAFLNQHIFKVVFDKIDISKNFFRYAVSSKLNDMIKNAHGATMKHIVKGDFDNTPIPIPPLPEQERIVSELDCINGILEKKREQIKELDALAQSIFYHMFGDPVTNEKGWEVKKLKDSVWEMFLGPFGSALKTDCYVEKDESFCMVYEQKHAIKKTLELDTHYITKEKFDNLSRFEVHAGDFIMSCRGTIGEIYELPVNAPQGIIHPSLMKIRIKQDAYVPKFFIRLLTCIIKNESTSGNCVQMAITAKELGAKNVPLPPLSLQQSFATKIAAIEKQKELIKRSIAEVETLLASRMQHYFNS